jgi:hypothetical protein
MKKKCATTYSPAFLDPEVGLKFYAMLKDSIPWEPVIRDKKLLSKGKVVELNEYLDVLDMVMHCLNSMATRAYAVHSIHLNLYETGAMVFPYSTHQGTHHLIIALGCTRTLFVGKKRYQLNNGDAILFGYGYYRIPEQTTTEGTILITVFMQPVGSL